MLILPVNFITARPVWSSANGIGAIVGSLFYLMDNHDDYWLILSTFHLAFFPVYLCILLLPFLLSLFLLFVILLHLLFLLFPYFCPSWNKPRIAANFCTVEPNILCHECGISFLLSFWRPHIFGKFVCPWNKLISVVFTLFLCPCYPRMNINVSAVIRFVTPACAHQKLTYTYRTVLLPCPDRVVSLGI